MDSIGRDTATEFIKRIELAMNGLNKAGEALRPVLTEKHFRIFIDAFGAAIGELDLGVLEIIYRCHPDLRPAGMTKVSTLHQIEQCSDGSCHVDKLKDPTAPKDN
jgi:hypothetical protein